MLNGLMVSLQSGWTRCRHALMRVEPPPETSGSEPNEKPLSALPRDELIVLIWPWDDDAQNRLTVNDSLEQPFHRRLRPPEVVSSFGKQCITP